MTIRSERPALPMLETPPPVTGAPRVPATPASEIVEYGTEAGVLPTFHVWTLGCQMNQSDSEEMAGALLAAGCKEAADLESARLIVINTCSIRDAAEQNVLQARQPPRSHDDQVGADLVGPLRDRLRGEHRGHRGLHRDVRGLHSRHPLVELAGGRLPTISLEALRKHDT